MADARRTAPNNIYTVLAFIAFLILAFGVVYVFIRYGTVFGGTPFTGGSANAADAVRVLAMLC